MTAHSDILDTMTKAELICWIRSRVHTRPRKSDLLFARWDAQSKTLEAERKQEIDRFAKVDFKRRDELARKFNASTDAQEKAALLKQIYPYDKAMSDHIEINQAQDRKWDQLQRMYDQIDVEIAKERTR